MIAVSFSIRVGSIEFEKSLTPSSSFEGCMIPLEVAIIGVKQLICLGDAKLIFYRIKDRYASLLSKYRTLVNAMISKEK
jgi:hypothetical protein